ncbi:MAG TPA: hypothetical protein PKA10_03045 [Selenomonadales bacterium]|nr:hypothetical protein [Selenomonadales bacterium]
MKKLLAIAVVAMAATFLPLSAYAAPTHHAPPRHSQAWKNDHNRKWKEHEKEWREYDRQWKAHRNDRRWREAKAREWHEWYKWHRDNDSEFHLRIGTDDFVLDIDRD